MITLSLAPVRAGNKWGAKLMVVCVTELPGGRAGGGFGRAHAVLVAQVEGGQVVERTSHEVRWDELHDTRAEGLHHAEIARFLRTSGVQLVLTGHMGPGMQRMLSSMGIEARTGVMGDMEAVLGGL